MTEFLYLCRIVIDSRQLIERNVVAYRRYASGCQILRMRVQSCVLRLQADGDPWRGLIIVMTNQMIERDVLLTFLLPMEFTR